MFFDAVAPTYKFAMLEVAIAVVLLLFAFFLSRVADKFLYKYEQSKNT